VYLRRGVLVVPDSMPIIVSLTVRHSEAHIGIKVFFEIGGGAL
jgi:hypothetical protein